MDVDRDLYYIKWNVIDWALDSMCPAFHSTKYCLNKVNYIVHIWVFNLSVNGIFSYLDSWKFMQKDGTTKIYHSRWVFSAFGVRPRYSSFLSTPNTFLLTLTMNLSNESFLNILIHLGLLNKILAVVRYFRTKLFLLACHHGIVSRMVRPC